MYYLWYLCPNHYLVLSIPTTSSSFHCCTPPIFQNIPHCWLLPAPIFTSQESRRLRFDPARVTTREPRLSYQWIPRFMAILMWKVMRKHSMSGGISALETSAQWWNSVLKCCKVVSLDFGSNMKCASIQFCSYPGLTPIRWVVLNSAREWKNSLTRCALGCWNSCSPTGSIGCHLAINLGDWNIVYK